MDSKKPVKIVNRTSPCRCGCGGTDPWHQSTYTRVIRNVENVPFEANTGMKDRYVISKRGTVKAPWGEATVEFAHLSFDGRVFQGEWRFAR